MVPGNGKGTNPDEKHHLDAIDKKEHPTYLRSKEY
jgi:hypothetical protein